MVCEGGGEGQMGRGEPCEMCVYPFCTDIHCMSLPTRHTAVYTMRKVSLLCH